MVNKTAGYLVELKDGRKGRTYHYKGTIKRKIPVYIEPNKPRVFHEFEQIPVYIEDNNIPLLVERSALKIIGHID